MIFLAGSSGGFVGTAGTVRLIALVSASPPLKLTGVGGASLPALFEKVEMVGASLNGLTVTVNVRVVRLFEAPPSFTVTVTTAVPLAFAMGASNRLPVVPGLA